MRSRALGQFYTRFLFYRDGSELRQGTSEHGTAYRTSCKAVQPVVVMVFRLELPFVDRAATTGSLHSVFRSEVFGQKLMNSGDASVKCEGAFVADSHGEAGVNKALPEVRIIDDVPDSPFLRDGWHHPVEAQTVARLFPVFRHWLRACTDISTVTRQHDSGKPGFATELIDQIGRLPPVCITHCPFDFQHGSILALPLACEQVIRQSSQSSIQATFKSSPR